MREDFVNLLKTKGINIPPHHEELLQNQWNAYLQLKSNPKLAEFRDVNIGLVHIPGGDKNE